MGVKNVLSGVPTGVKDLIIKIRSKEYNCQNICLLFLIMTGKVYL